MVYNIVQIQIESLQNVISAKAYAKCNIFTKQSKKFSVSYDSKDEWDTGLPILFIYLFIYKTAKVGIMTLQSPEILCEYGLTITIQSIRRYCFGKKMGIQRQNRGFKGLRALNIIWQTAANHKNQPSYGVLGECFE